MIYVPMGRGGMVIPTHSSYTGYSSSYGISGNIIANVCLFLIGNITFIGAILLFWYMYKSSSDLPEKVICIVCSVVFALLEIAFLSSTFYGGS